MVIICLQQIKSVNGFYLALQIRQEKTYALAIRVFDRIEQYTDFNENTKIIFIGSTLNKDVSKRGDTFGVLTDGITGIDYYYFLDGQEDWADYAADSLGIEYSQVSNDTAQEWEERKEVQAMPMFPANGSIRRIDGSIVVKIYEE